MSVTSAAAHSTLRFDGTRIRVQTVRSNTISEWFTRDPGRLAGTVCYSYWQRVKNTLLRCVRGNECWVTESNAVRRSRCGTRSDLTLSVRGTQEGALGEQCSDGLTSGISLRAQKQSAGFDPSHLFRNRGLQKPLWKGVLLSGLFRLSHAVIVPSIQPSSSFLRISCDFALSRMRKFPT